MQKDKITYRRTYLYIVTLFLAVAGFTACTKDEIDPDDLPKPTIENVEIGLANNEIGIIGRDFHFNADVVAGDKIDRITIKIQQISGESYSQPWEHEVIWTQYKGARNTNVHKHFDIPADAIEGRYDFVIVVDDENGTQLEEKRILTIYSPANLPLDLRFDFGVDRSDVDSNPLDAVYSYQYVMDEVYQSAEPAKRGDFLIPVIGLAGIKGDGKAYCLLINKKHNHRPESIDAIDFSKVIVADVWEHSGINESTYGSNMFDFTTSPLSFFSPTIQVGASDDRNTPAQPITDNRAWESGSYYIGFIYHNSTYHMGTFHYGEVSIAMN